MNKITKYYYESAKRLGLNVKPSKELYGFEFIIGKHKYIIRNGFIPINDSASTNIAHNKHATNRILSKAGFPVPDSFTVNRKDYQDNHINLDSMPYPVVVKPAVGSAFGKDVVCNIKHRALLEEYMDYAFKKYRQLTIEHFEENLTSYRVLVLDNEVIGLVERTPAFVVGNGKDSLNRLIQERDKQREQLGLPKIILNAETQIILKERKLNLDSIPNKDEFIPLRYVCNYSQGGTFASLSTDEIHPDNGKMILGAVKAINLRYVGFDVLCEDIRKPISQTRGYFIEANPNPGIYFHEEPYEGKPVCVSEKVILKQLAEHPLHYAWFQCKRRWVAVSLLSTLLLGAASFGIYYFF